MFSDTSAMENPPLSVSLVVGTPEHEAYYYEKIERSIYKGMDECVAECPNIAPSITWVSLGDAGQKAIVAKVKGVLAYGKSRLDIEDQKEVDDATEAFVGMILARMIVGPAKPVQSSPKKPKKALASNSLFKTAICHSRVERQTKSPTS